jgi:hypothetical protein
MDAGADLDGMGVIAEDTETSAGNVGAAIEAGREAGLSEEADTADAIEAAAEADATAEKDKAVAEQQEAQALTRISEVNGLWSAMGKHRRKQAEALGATPETTYYFKDHKEAGVALNDGSLQPGDFVYVEGTGVFQVTEDTVGD